MNNTLVLGIGNVLLSDEGVGVRVVEMLAARAGSWPPGAPVELVDGGTLSFTLAAPIGDAARLIVVDAARLDRPAGTVETFLDDKMDTFLGTRKRSVHEVGLLDLMDMARLAGDLPPRRALVAIQPGKIDWGSTLTAEVNAAATRACDIVGSLIREWNTVDEHRLAPV